ncbi:hypothetical protein SCHPADRAFT_935112 [Schizopora paradoxa]|uniref:Uncharacterized protein n=1 Tax=Schizopora paradoxa TaxID=27342 RepID=A0A0H2SRB3_9AGAM|nr:hypothetical protein SCHPADRAFT_935112 [Schizopora paradoxa]
MSGVKREGCSVAPNSEGDEMGRCEGTRTKGGRCSKLAKDNGNGRFFCSYHIDQLYDPPKRTGKSSAWVSIQEAEKWKFLKQRELALFAGIISSKGRISSSLFIISQDDIANELERISLRMENMERNVSETSILIGMHDASLQSIINLAFRANSRGDSRAADLDDAPTDIDTDDESDAEQGGEGGKLMKQDGAGISEPERVSSAVRQPIHDDRKLKRVTTSPRRSPRLFGSDSSDVYPPGSFNPFGAGRMVL